MENNHSINEKSKKMEFLRQEFDQEVYPFFNKREEILKKETFRKKKPNQPIKLKKEFTTSNGTKYSILSICDNTGYNAFFHTQFEWNGENAFAELLDNGNITVFSSHALKRYAERVLHDSDKSPKDIFCNHIQAKLSNSFYIVLPSPTHEKSIYLGVRNVLFLGDFIDSKTNGQWINTCLSIKEMMAAQLRILNSLGELTLFVQKLGFDPIPFNRNITREEIKRINKFILENPDNIEAYKRFCCLKYMFCLLHADAGYGFTNQMIMNKYITGLSEKLNKFGINISSLSPYDEISGIVRKGEIDYNPLLKQKYYGI